MLPPIIINLLEGKIGKNIRYSSDFEYLSFDIEKDTGKSISVNTLKRLLGYMKGVKEPRLYTLDVIAEYLSYDNWDQLIQSIDMNDASSSFSSIEEIEIQKLKVSDKIRFEYSPDRLVTVEFIEGNKFIVVESINSKLKRGDIVELNYFVLNHPLIATNVTRNGVSLGKFTAGKHSGIVSLTLL